MQLKNGDTLTISRAEKTDAQGILDFLNLIGGETDNLLFGAGDFQITVKEEEVFIQSMAEAKTSILLVGKIDGNIVGIASATSPVQERVAHQAEIAVSIKKSAWGLGIGTQLMRTLIDFAKTNGKTEVLHLGVREDNLSAIHLYKKLGFQTIGRYPKFFKVQGSYSDEILMNLYL